MCISSSFLSLLSNGQPGRTEFYSLHFGNTCSFQRFENKLLFKKKDTINNSIEEGYGLKITPESDYGDTCYLTYSAALNTVPYTFSKEMDSMTGMKLIKMKTTNYPNKYNKFIRDYVEQNYWMNFVPVTNEKEIMRFFNELGN
jgi:hypothetical protein